MARRRPGHLEVPDARLDDLLRAEYGQSRPLPTRDRLPPASGVAIQAFLLSAVAYTISRVFNVALPYPLALAVCLGAVVIRHTVRSVAEPDWLRSDAPVRAPGPPRRIDPGGWYSQGDAVLSAVRRWERRFEWGADYPERFDRTVLGPLRVLVDERLRQRYGITRDSDPTQARQLLGDRAWAVLTGPPATVVTTRELDAVVERLEQW